MNRVRRVLVALGVAGVLIGGAYVLSNPNLFAPSAANAESTQALLQAYAQKKGPDGLPLWEDQLIATASSTAWSAAASSTPEEPLAPAPNAAPGSLTDQFAQALFMQYIEQEAPNNPSDEDIDTFAQDAINTLVQDHQQQNPYTAADVKIAEGSGSDALVNYAATVDIAINNNTADTNENELDYFSDAVEKNDLGALVQVAAIGKAYSGLSAALVQIPVPSYAQGPQLELANAMSKIGADITDMSTMETDPLRAYLGLSEYETDGPALIQAYSDMYGIFQTQGVSIASGPGSNFYSVLSAAQPQTGGSSQ